MLQINGRNPAHLSLFHLNRSTYTLHWDRIISYLIPGLPSICSISSLFFFGICVLLITKLNRCWSTNEHSFLDHDFTFELFTRETRRPQTNTDVFSLSIANLQAKWVPICRRILSHMSIHPQMSLALKMPSTPGIWACSGLALSTAFS